ncbi:MAG: hypothetical protein ABJA18_12250 [bacterium]
MKRAAGDGGGTNLPRSLIREEIALLCRPHPRANISYFPFDPGVRFASPQALCSPPASRVKEGRENNHPAVTDFVFWAREPIVAN